MSTTATTKKPRKKSPTKPKAKREPKYCMRWPQVVILQTMTDGEWWTRKEIVKETKLCAGWMTRLIGAIDPKTREKSDNYEWEGETSSYRGFPSLVSLGALIASSRENEHSNQENIYRISAKGKQLLERAKLEYAHRERVKTTVKAVEKLFKEVKKELAPQE